MTDYILDYQFNHVFLPPRVPQADDHGNGAGDRALVDRLVLLAPQFRDVNDTRFYQQWSMLNQTLRSFASLHRHNNALSKDSLRSAFQGIRDGGIVILHVAIQNSGLIVRKAAAEYIIESFETSPPAAEVLSASGALQWDFPSRAVAVAAVIFEETAFQACFTEYLEQASVEPVKQFAATTLKAGSLAFESRDTATPAIVGQLLMSLLEANGHKHTPIITCKRVHDEVSWGDGAENPWRRSATWLVLRVSLQRCLCFMLGGSFGTLHYKFFMCFVMSSMCKDFCTAPSGPPDRLSFARSKLARRLDKLQRQRDVGSPQMADAIDSLTTKFKNIFKNTISLANDNLEAMWRLIRARATKRIEALPRRADPGATVPTLSHSRAFLYKVLDEALYGRTTTPLRLEQRVRNGHRGGIKSINVDSRKPRSAFDYLNLADAEVDLKLTIARYARLEGLEGLDQICVEVMHKLKQYQNTALPAYTSDPEQVSLMLLIIMELWQVLDSAAVLACPLLANYDPGFPRDLLYPLQLPRLDDMSRAQRVERYIEKRRSLADLWLPPIFGDHAPGSFAVRYFDQSRSMQELLKNIQAADDASRIQKEEEWKQSSAEYEDILREAAATACLFVEDVLDPSKRHHDDRRCRKHYLERKSRRMRILIHEAILPTELIAAKTVIFELLLPKDFAAWRDTTWNVLQLARRAAISDNAPQVLLRDYQGFIGYTRPASCNITIASRTKSFYNTHYANCPFPISLDKVCLSHGLKYGLHDHSSGLWTSKHAESPNFADLCSVPLASQSVYYSLRKYMHPTYENTSASANDVIASQTKCPNNLTMAEYLSFQDLKLGYSVRWIRLLRELASPNLNFGTQEVGTLVTGLALMLGPSEGESCLRASHWVFRDPEYCEALALQIKKRLDGLASNWREGQTIGCMIMLLKRMWSLATSSASVEAAERLLLFTREVTHKWTRLLRDEICNATNIETAQKRSKDALLAAFLSRKTLIIEAEKPSQLLQPEVLTCFLECAFTLKENLPKNDDNHIAKLSTPAKRLLVADLKLVHRLEGQLRRSIEASPEAVSMAVNSVWAEARGDTSRMYSPWEFLPAPHSGWLTAKSIARNGFLEQTIHIDTIEGTLLIDGQPLGRLPEEYTKQQFFQQLFGARIFLTRPSSIYGMSYMLASLFQGHEIHFGFRNSVAFVRARSSGRILEMIPPAVFHANIGVDTPDLPLPLINNCVHWLDLAARILEIRPYVSIWQSKLSNWRINLYTNVAHRRTSRLVDPRSQLYNRVVSLIEPFENRNKMTVFQPGRGNLSLHMPALELSFHVNREGLLESQQLRAVVDMNQDAGTLYGMNSSLVLRDSTVPDERSIIVAMGPAEIGRGPGNRHVEVRVEHTGFYARFSINKELKRLECAAEPRLIYFKAYCHAITAFVLPDPLTGRTGTDEAIHCLQAGNAQPWAPVDEESYRILSSIARLTPQRFYYPEKLKVLQKVSWSEILLPPVQNGAFRPIVEDIVHQCRLLHRFHLSSDVPPVIEQPSNSHLLIRAATRNQLHRASQHQLSTSAEINRKYVARDCAHNANSKNAYEISVIFKNWSSCLAVSHDLAVTMREWPAIQGFDHDFDLYLFTDLINIKLASQWGSLFRFCTESQGLSDKYKLMFLFATVAFDAHIDLTVIRSLAAATIMEDFKSLQLPQSSEFLHFQGDQVPTVDFLMQLMKPYRTPYPEDERSLLLVPMHPKQKRKLEMAQLKHEEDSEKSCKLLATRLLSQWPCREPCLIETGDVLLLDPLKAILAIKPEWERLFDNHQLSEHLASVQKILDTCKVADTPPILSNALGQRSVYLTLLDPKPQPTMWELLSKPFAYNNLTNDVGKGSQAFRLEAFLQTKSLADSPIRQPISSPMPIQALSASRSPKMVYVSELKSIVAPFTQSEDSVRQMYGRDLEKSIAALEQMETESMSSALCAAPKIDPARLASTIESSRSAVQDHFEMIRNALHFEEDWLEAGGLLPDITPITLFEMLPLLAANEHDTVCMRVIVQFAESVVTLQHLLRIQSAYQRKDTIQLAGEALQDAQWGPKNCIDWLLLQLDFNFLIRREQYQVAQAMITPQSGTNSVLQMNMGQGKSSVIIPMIVAFLADGKHLARVVVPRPLLLQTAQLLQSRLGGLIGRRLKHVPFSRKSPVDVQTLKAYHALQADILQNRGVILTLPEHLLSFQLSGLQELSNGNIPQATSMIRLQDWFAKKCKDILDECDHMLAVKTQLIYPSGSQSMVDGHPSRWTVVQDLLKLVKIHLSRLQHEFPRGIEVIERGSGTFPTIYLLNQDVKDCLMSRLTDSVVNGDGGILPMDDCSEDELELMKKFIRHAIFPKNVALQVAAIFKDKISKTRLMLVKDCFFFEGFFKRWNVQYGIDPRRDPIAVPYRSKGIPSDQAEHGHPDVSILLTCLSFYYAGLTLPQFQQALNQLLKCDEPVREFESWKQGSLSFPDSLSSWNSINMEDETQCTQLWRLLYRQISVINFFLNHFVFPRYARTFERKLVSSGWDIAVQSSAPNVGASLRLKENIPPCSNGDVVSLLKSEPTSLTVGFSGTNDNKTLLPLNIIQDDLPGLSHTNAEVLTYLLQPRNRRYYPAVDIRGKRLTEDDFLRKLHGLNIRMLLDAGAQIIEMDNTSLAQAWLTIDFEAEAAVYFGEDGRARVLYRDGRGQPLAGSPFFNNLGSCVVYLDEAHTRGVDLKMPENATAALTLGIMQTKDHTVQAAMRLRQLAISQSVVFFAPPEVYQSILNVRGKTGAHSIDSYDVIVWLLEQTCCNIEQLQPLYISQGQEHCRRRIAAQKNPNASVSPEERRAYLKVLEQLEQYSLEKLYAPDQKSKARPLDTAGFPEIAQFVSRLNDMKRNLHDTGNTVQALAHQEVEQEREVHIEVETVREVKKPSHAQALPQPFLQKDVKSFVETGRLVAGSHAYQQAFVTLRHTALGLRLHVQDSATKSRLYVTQDFGSTVVNQWNKPRDEYLRPVHWVLWSTVTDTSLICSEFEADAVLPLVRDRQPVCTHMLAYAAPATRAMLIFDTLSFYNVPSLPKNWQAPPWLVRDLGLFAGRLYFDYNEQSQLLYQALGLPPPASVATKLPLNLSEQELWQELPFQEVPMDDRTEPFFTLPLLFMQEWLAIRRKGQDFSQTMMGELCRGRRPDVVEDGRIEGAEDPDRESEARVSEIADSELNEIA